MQRVQGYSRLDDGSGAPAPSCTVTVYLTGTQTLATIYSDNLANPTAKANPFTADANGYWFFYGIGSWLYDVQISGGGIATPYVLVADLPAGLGNGTLFSVARASLPAGGSAHIGRLYRVSDDQGGLFVYDGSAWVPVLDYALTSKAQGSLPAAGTAGRIRRVTDSPGGLWVDDGSAWNSVLAYGIPSATKAGLPAAGTAGRLRRVSDNQRGLWLDNSSAWYPVNGGACNAIEFGADPTGATDSSAAINSALALAAGAVVVPPGTYKITSPIKLYDRTRLVGYGATLTVGAGWSGDAVFMAQNRDDNTIANLVQAVVSGFKVDATSNFTNSGVMLDLTGFAFSRFQDLYFLAGGTFGVTTRAVVRLADNNQSGTSDKLSQQNIVQNVRASGGNFGIDVSQAATRAVDQLLSALFLGCNFTGVLVNAVRFSTGSATTPVRLGMLQCTFVASGAPALGISGTRPQGLWMAGCDITGWVSVGNWPGSEASLEANGRYVGASGTTSAAPLASGGTASRRWDGSVYVKVASGTVLSSGTNTYTYTMVQMPTGATLQASVCAGLPTTCIAVQAAVSGNTVTLTICAAAGFTLGADLVLRLVGVAP